ncbi:MAG TPA: CpaF family protein [Polyangiaceae bacterium]|nr:CpaF family protein [Polyangiaceae bacterium]
MIPNEIYQQTVLAHFGPIRPFLEDASVSEIMINGPDQIYIERRGCLERVEARFSSRDTLLAALRNVSQFIGKLIDEEHPILEGRLPDGSRLEAVIPPAFPDGPCVAIRRFFRETLTVNRLVEFGSLTSVAAEALRAFVIAKANIVVAGGTGSGKTSLLNALSGFIPESERVIVIEDAREVQLQQPHVIQLEARPPDPRGRGAVSIRDLFRATLRLRPDRVVVGEIRGGEALDIVQAMTSGHGGCMGTLHASFPRDTMNRLETMALMNDIGLPLAALRGQIGSGLNLIVQVSRYRDGSRKISHITEVAGYDAQAQSYDLRDLFVREYDGFDADNRVRSTLVPTGVLPSFLPQLEEHGMTLPTAMLERVAAGLPSA